MAVKSANMYARVEPDVKEQAESILSALGKGMSHGDLSPWLIGYQAVGIQLPDRSYL